MQGKEFRVAVCQCPVLQAGMYLNIVDLLNKEYERYKLSEKRNRETYCIITIRLGISRVVCASSMDWGSSHIVCLSCTIHWLCMVDFKEEQLVSEERDI